MIQRNFQLNVTTLTSELPKSIGQFAKQNCLQPPQLFRLRLSPELIPADMCLQKRLLKQVLGGSSVIGESEEEMEHTLLERP